MATATPTRSPGRPDVRDPLFPSSPPFPFLGEFRISGVDVVEVPAPIPDSEDGTNGAYDAYEQATPTSIADSTDGNDGDCDVNEQAFPEDGNDATATPTSSLLRLAEQFDQDNARDFFDVWAGRDVADEETATTKPTRITEARRPRLLPRQLGIPTPHNDYRSPRRQKPPRIPNRQTPLQDAKLPYFFLWHLLLRWFNVEKIRLKTVTMATATPRGEFRISGVDVVEVPAPIPDSEDGTNAPTTPTRSLLRADERDKISFPEDGNDDDCDPTSSLSRLVEQNSIKTMQGRFLMFRQPGAKVNNDLALKTVTMATATPTRSPGRPDANFVLVALTSSRSAPIPDSEDGKNGDPDANEITFESR
ncbi:hypothetical protein BC829DRAFT_446069 [Chytridium lagenaria]|nr:hypothetical protein BC829DRAFT_446069 [Chytridium lagenaria]